MSSRGAPYIERDRARPDSWHRAAHHILRETETDRDKDRETETETDRQRERDKYYTKLTYYTHTHRSAHQVDVTGQRHESDYGGALRPGEGTTASAS